MICLFNQLKNTIKSFRSLFSTIQMVVLMLMLFTISTVYLFLTTNHITLSVIFGAITMVIGFYILIYLPKKVSVERELLKDLQKYVMNMSFYLQSGFNVLYSLEQSKTRMSQQVTNDIQNVIDGLKENAVLDTSAFKKYHFYPIDVFHQILEIKYTKGGDARELFDKVNKALNFELVKRDELYRRKRNLKERVLMMMLMVAAMPLIFYFLQHDMYVQFLSQGWLAIGLNLTMYVLLLISLVFLQKNAYDIELN